MAVEESEERTEQPAQVKKDLRAGRKNLHRKYDHQQRARTLKESREAAGYTQQSLAEKTRLSIATVRDLEQGHRVYVRSATWAKLCEACGVSTYTGFSDIRLQRERWSGAQWER